MHRLLYLGTVAALTTITLGSAEIPLTATVELHQYVTEAGTTTESNHETGKLVRDHQGNQATWMNDAKTGQPSSTHIVAHGKGYSVQHKMRTYSTGNATPEVSDDIIQALQRSHAETQVINGIACLVVPIQNGSSNQPAGMTCLSPDYHIVVKQEINVHLPNGRTGKIVKEISNLAAGTEPEPKWFQPPIQGYSLCTTNCAGGLDHPVAPKTN